MQLAHAWPSAVYILPTLAFSVVYNIPRFFELTTAAGPAHSVTVVATELRRDLRYREVYILYMNIMIHGVTPLVALLFMNVSVYRNLNKYRWEWNYGRRQIRSAIKNSFLATLSRGEQTIMLK